MSLEWVASEDGTHLSVFVVLDEPLPSPSLGDPCMALPIAGDGPDREAMCRAAQLGYFVGKFAVFR